MQRERKKKMLKCHIITIQNSSDTQRNIQSIFVHRRDIFPATFRIFAT